MRERLTPGFTGVRRFAFCFSLLLLLAGSRGSEVRDRGAKGDGVADDTDAIQQAVNVGGPVRFSRGTYRLTRTVTIDLEKNGHLNLAGDGAAVVRMDGPGPAFHFVGTLVRNANPAELPKNVWEKQVMPGIDRLAIVGGHPEAVGVRVTRVMQFSVTGCHFRQLLHGIHLTQSNRNVLIANCHVFDNRGVGIYLDAVDLHQINIGNCHISYNRGGGVVTRRGQVRNLQISGCDIEGNMHPDSPATANVLLDSTGGSTAEVEITGCTIQHWHTVHGSANIRVIGEGSPVGGSKELRWGQLVINGNVINDAEINIHLDRVRSAVISGNTIHRGQQHDILVVKSARVALSGNVFDRHPLYASNENVKQGIVFRDSADCLMTGLQIHGGPAMAAILIEGGRRFHITDCTVVDAKELALLLNGVSGSFIHGNMLDMGDAARTALRVTGGRDNVVRDNHVIGRIEVD